METWEHGGHGRAACCLAPLPAPLLAPGCLTQDARGAQGQWLLAAAGTTALTVVANATGNVPVVGGMSQCLQYTHQTTLSSPTRLVALAMTSPR